VRDDREAVRLEDREERLVGLRDGHLLRREDGRLDVADLAAEDESLARQLADDADELRQVGVLERERDALAAGSRLELDPRLEPLIFGTRALAPRSGSEAVERTSR
jgi:hypothetical protein